MRKILHNYWPLGLSILLITIVVLILNACTPTVVTPPTKVSDLVALSSSCLGKSISGKGAPPAGYIKGMTIVYAKAVCNQESGINKILSQPDNGSKDVFMQYGLSPKQGIESLRKTYQILIGLGMRESSGRYCCGRDMSAGFSSSDGAEAGLFQTSYNARAVSSELPLLFSRFKNDKSKCYLDVFQEGVKTCSSGDLKNWGSGDGYDYQKLSKECPAFHAEFSAVVIRKLHNHFGPLKRKEAEVACEPLLLSIEKFVAEHKDICSQL